MTKAPSPAVRQFSWAEVIALCHGLADLVDQSSPRPEAIACVLRGGAFPALLLSHLLDVPDVHAIAARTTTSEAVRANTAPVALDAARLPDLTARHVLLVDDVTNTGRTIHAAAVAVRHTGAADVTTACLLFDTVDPNGATPLTDCPVDLRAADVHAWAGFPWEAEAGKRGLVASRGGAGPSQSAR